MVPLVARHILAIIPARGGSKGIPGKNVRPLAGKPLVAHSIDQALRTPGISRVVVSTDDDRIAGVAVEYGAEVVSRPAEISGDLASSESALLHVLDTMQATEEYEPDLVVFLQPTSPLRAGDDIQRAIDTLDREHADSLLSVGPLHGFVWRQTREGLSSFSYDHRRRPRRQDAPEDFLENGSIYVFKPSVLRDQGNRLGGSIAVYLMSAANSFQIDEPGDFEFFETLMSGRRTQEMPGLDQVRLLVLDFDGVMTDNRVLVAEDGTEAVWCSRSDGWGLARLRDAGIEVLVLSSEKNPVVAARCRKLGIPCEQGSDEKLAALKAIAADRGLSRDQIAFVGNDVNDLECLGWAGVPIVVQDADPRARAAARWVTTSRGGQGAVREVCDTLVRASQTEQGGVR